MILANGVMERHCTSLNDFYVDSHPFLWGNNDIGIEYWNPNFNELYKTMYLSIGWYLHS